MTGKKKLITIVVNELKKIEEIKAIVLAGSYATGSQRSDSDIDFGVFYKSNNPLNINKIIKAAQNLGSGSKAIISKIGEWGKWMNGGAWLIIDKQRVDFIYREIDFVVKTIDECIGGKIETDYYQQPAYGFYSYIYCAEIKFSKSLYDPSNIITKLKQKVISYPQLLKEKIINTFLWDAQFSLSLVQKSAKHNETYIVAGCITRIINDLIQVLYALNETFFISEKRYLHDIDLFSIKPANFTNQTQEILSSINNKKSMKSIEQLINSLIILSKDIYKPKYLRNLDESRLS